ncbi:MAG: SH3 domain-containing protein [Syntrophomonadaceae bacterium]|nr:SH3 domain-containing protein [Syntrophomonadaceae bacterium]
MLGKRNKIFFISLLAFLGLLTAGLPAAHAQAATASITASVVNVRSGPGTAYQIIGKVNAESLVTILDIESGWAKIRSGELQGWVNDDFLAVEEQEPPDAAVPQVILNGKPVSFTVSPRMVNNRLLVPLRSVFEAIGSTIKWDQATQTASIARHNLAIMLPINSTTATVNGKAWKLDVPAQVAQQQILVPLRFVAESLGGCVGWDSDINTVYITAPAAGGAKPLAVEAGSAKVNLRSGPGLNYSVTGSALSGETLPILDEENGFFKVKRQGTEAWVASWVVNVVWGYNVEWKPGMMD